MVMKGSKSDRVRRISSNEVYLILTIYSHLLVVMLDIQYRSGRSFNYLVTGFVGEPYTRALIQNGP